MEEDELRQQLQAATSFILDSKQESVQFKAGAEAYRALTEKVIQEVAQALQKRPDAVVSQEQLKQIAQAAATGAKAGVANTECKLPNTDSITESIANEAAKQILDKIDPYIKQSMDRHHARIDVYHEHHHTNMYGQFASSETNRKMMCWLAFVNLLYLSQLAIFLLRWYKLIDWDWTAIQTSYIVTIIVTVLGGIIRIFSSTK